MTAFTIKRATKASAKLRLALIGPSGSGKTYSALSIAQHLAAGGKGVCLIDTERKSASKYADLFAFDVLELDSFEPDTYCSAIDYVAAQGYGVLIIDSLSHAWMGKGGALEQVDRAAKRGGNSFSAWRDVTPMHNRLVDAILGAPMHIIATVRAKTEWAMETDKGKTTVRKVGMAPVQRDGLEYEFDVVGDMTLDNELLVSKTRCPAMAGKAFPKPGKAMAEVLSAWLGAERLPPEPVAPQLPSGTSEAADTVLRPSTPAEAPKEPALVNGGSESALWSTYAAEISQAMSLANLQVLAKGIKINAKQGKLTPTQVGHLSEMGKARRAALEAEPRTVAAALEGNQLPVSWGGPTEAEDLCVTCKAPLGASAAVSTTDADGVVGFRHQACGAPA